MLDPELDQLSRALIAATDRLNSEDFRSRQARLVAIEDEAEAASVLHEERRQQILAEFREATGRLQDERDTLSATLEADERAVEAAQDALTAHVAANYLTSDLMQSVESDDTLFEGVVAFPAEEEKWDETASARGGGGLNDTPN